MVLLSALMSLVLITELVLSSELCPCGEEAGGTLVCRDWQDSCPHDPISATNLLVITASPSLSTINISNIITQAPGTE